MYDDYAFGDGRLASEDPAVQPWPEGSAPQPATIAWLEAAHDRLAGHVAALDDDARLASRGRRTGASRARRAGSWRR